MAQKVDLDQIKNIPEDEFKRNLYEWVEQMDISKELQSKLRSDLFQNFGKTALGNKLYVFCNCIGISILYSSRSSNCCPIPTISTNGSITVSFSHQYPGR